MTILIGPLLNTFLSLFIGMCIRYYPLKNKLRISVKSLVGIYAIVFLMQCAVFLYFKEIFSADYIGNQHFKALSGLFIMLLPFFLIRRAFFQNLFLMTIVAHYLVVIFGIGNYIELVHGGAFAAEYPYIICDAVIIILSIPILPFALLLLRRLFHLWQGENVLIWKFIWLIPTLSIVFCLSTGNVLTDKANAATPIFLIGRLFISAGMIVTCFVLAKVLHQEAKNAALTENVRMTENQLALQREQYELMAENAEAVKAQHHDFRHQLAVIKGYNNSGARETLNAYLEELSASIPTDGERMLCENFAVNAVALHYVALAENEGIETSIQLIIPKKTGRVKDSDLSIIVGNFLENALEACRRVTNGDRFIKLRSRVQNDMLVITMDNSFDGYYNKKDEIFYSRKRDGRGVGLSSVLAVAKKYGGNAKFEAKENVFLSSVYVNMSEPETPAEVSHGVNVLE